MDVDEGGANATQALHGHDNDETNMDLDVDPTLPHDDPGNDNPRDNDVLMDIPVEIPNEPIPHADAEEDVPVQPAADNRPAGVPNPTMLQRGSASDAFPDLSRPLFDGASMTQGNFSLAMSHIKTKHNVSKAAMASLYKLVSKAMPAGNIVPKTTYKARKNLAATGLRYETIHACPNHCILYRGETLKDLSQCPICQEPRYYPETKSAKQVWRNKTSSTVSYRLVVI